jgi:DNA-binding beta-propeller fold protein YncE
VKKQMLMTAALMLAAALCHGQLVLSGNENKLDLSAGSAKMIAGAEPDSISILDFSQFPPSVRHIHGIRNSVIGPPSNIAITPDEGLALIASSLVAAPGDPTGYAPDTIIHVLDLTQDPPVVIDEIKAGRQPSGMSITRDGRFALVANRASGTVSLLGIEGKSVRLLETVKVCEPEDSLSDVAVTPDGRTAVASVCEGGYMALLKLENGHLTATDQKLSTCGKPYRVVMSPDGDFALTAGSGQGMPNVDAVTVVDLRSNPIHTVDYVPVPPEPESLEISPDGKLVAVVLMNGSSVATDHPMRTEKGILAILVRKGRTFVKTQELPVGRIPEGVAFSPDGKHIIVQCHAERRLWLFDVQGEKVRDTGERISVPGFPSSLRTAEKPLNP